MYTQKKIPCTANWIRRRAEQTESGRCLYGDKLSWMGKPRRHALMFYGKKKLSSFFKTFVLAFRENLMMKSWGGWNLSDATCCCFPRVCEFNFRINLRESEPHPRESRRRSKLRACGGKITLTFDRDETSRLSAFGTRSKNSRNILIVLLAPAVWMLRTALAGIMQAKFQIKTLSSHRDLILIHLTC